MERKLGPQRPRLCVYRKSAVLTCSALVDCHAMVLVNCLTALLEAELRRNSAVELTQAARGLR
eukprot:6183338-Pleurochrysis_carterae.AAC.3